MVRVKWGPRLTALGTLAYYVLVLVPVAVGPIHISDSAVPRTTLMDLTVGLWRHDKPHVGP